MQSITHKKISWRHFSENDDATVAALERDFEFHSLDLEDVASPPQQPKTDFYKNYLFAIFHFPDYHKQEERIHVFELDAFLTDERMEELGPGEGRILK